VGEGATEGAGRDAERQRREWSSPSLAVLVSPLVEREGALQRSATNGECDGDGDEGWEGNGGWAWSGPLSASGRVGGAVGRAAGGGDEVVDEVGFEAALCFMSPGTYSVRAQCRLRRCDGDERDGDERDGDDKWDDENTSGDPVLRSAAPLRVVVS